MSASTSKTETVLRWIAFFPAAAAAAWIAWFLVKNLNRVSMSFSGFDPDSFLCRVFIDYISHMVLGGVFVFVGAMIAPFHRKVVAFILSVIGLVGAGFTSFPAIIARDYWSLWAIASLIFGLAVSAYSIMKSGWLSNEERTEL
jgi:hypothetical protein